MNAVELIQTNVQPLKLLQYYDFRNIKEFDNEIRACCEIHKGNNPNAFVWNKRNNFWYCYTGECGGGDTVELVRKIEHLSFYKACIKAAEILGIDISGIELAPQNDLLYEQKKWLKKQTERKNIELAEYTLPYTNYTQTHKTFSRFSKDVLEFYGAKFCTIYPIEGHLLRDKLVIPIIYNKSLVGVALRDTTGTAFPKWLYQPKGFKASQILYNIDRLNSKTDEVIVTEGIFDVWAFHNIGIDNAVCVFGSNVSKEQYEVLLKLNVTITLCFDNDDAGNKCTLKTTNMFKNKAELRYINLPKGCDPADLPAKDLLSAYLKRV